MPLILLTNDDGFGAPGLEALTARLSDLGQVWVIAPDVERSACGRAVTLHRPLRTVELAPRRIAVSGTPSDCVLLAVRSLLPAQPDLVVSGINNGYNIGEDVDYSGTVAAAAEGALQGAPASVAISVKAGSGPEILDEAAGFARRLAEALLARGLPEGTYLNVNLPSAPTRRVRWTRQGNRLPPGKVQVGEDPRGRPYYWVAERPDEVDPPPDTDRGAVQAGIISVSLLTLERTHRGAWTRPDLQRAGYEVEDAG